MLGLAVDPGYPTGSPYVYVLYAYDHILGERSAGAHAGRRDPATPTTIAARTRPGNDRRLRRLGPAVAADRPTRRRHDRRRGRPDRGLVPAVPQPLASAASMFGPEGALYVSGGDGASFNSGAPDYGQFGGTLPGTPTPVNPCGDPPAAADPTPPTAEGGALRSQDIRTTGDPTGLDGTILRVDPDTGRRLADNANIGSGDANARRIIAYGLRNPFRFTIKPGDGRGLGRRRRLQDLGGDQPARRTRTPRPRTSAGRATRATASTPFYDDLGLRPVRQPQRRRGHGAVLHVQPHAVDRVAATAAGPAARRSPGMAFLPRRARYPSSYDNGLFFTDYTPQLHLVHAGRTAAATRTSPARSAVRQPRPAGSETRRRRRVPDDRARPATSSTPTTTAARSAGSTTTAANVPPVASLHRHADVGPRAAARRLQRQRLDRRQRRHADLRLGPRRRRRSTTTRPASRPREPTPRSATSTVGLRVTDTAGAVRHDDTDRLRGNSPPSVSDRRARRPR